MCHGYIAIQKHENEATKHGQQKTMSHEGRRCFVDTCVVTFHPEINGDPKSIARVSFVSLLMKNPSVMT